MHFKAQVAAAAALQSRLGIALLCKLTVLGVVRKSRVEELLGVKLQQLPLQFSREGFQADNLVLRHRF